MKKLTLISIALLLYAAVFGQTGKEFWFAVPYVDKSHDKNKTDGIQTGPNYFRISTGEAGARVIFYHFPGGDSDSRAEMLNFTIAANSIETVSLVGGAPNASNKEIAITSLSSNGVYNTVLSKGLFIVASNPVTIYYEIGSYNNTDIFALKSSDALGLEFYPSFQNLYENEVQGGYATDSWESVDIVATEDGTDITIDLPTTNTAQSVLEYRTSTCVYKADNYLQREGATDIYFFKGGGAVEFFTNKKQSTYLNGVLQTSVSTPLVWNMPDDSTDLKYNHWRPGTTVIDDWYNNPSATKHRTTTKFQDQFDHSIFTSVKLSLTETCGSETVDSSKNLPISFAGIVSTNISLNAGQTYSLKSELRTAQKPFDGIRVSATKPIAVTTKDDSAKDGFAADVIGDQSIPTKVAGFKYIVPDFSTGAGMKQSLFVRALHDGTVINIKGQSNPVATLNQGEIFSFSSFSKNDSYKYVYGNDTLKPFMCFHVGGYPSGAAGTDTELAGAMIPPVDKYTGSMQASFNQPQTTSKIVLLSRTQEAGTYKYKQEGSSAWSNVNPTFSTVDIGGRTWYISFDLVALIVPEPGKNYLVKNTKSVFHLGILSRLEDAGSFGAFYGYFSDYSKASIQASFDTLPDGQVVLYAFGGIESSFDWSLVKPAAPTTSCEDNYFTPSANCSKANPIYIDKGILAVPGLYKYKINAVSPYGEQLISYIQFEVKDGKAKFVPLPVEFIYVSAQYIGGHTVAVHWSTASEKSNNYFTVERSGKDGKFEPVGVIPGSGDKSTQSNYSFTDAVPSSGIYYYRIKQTDFDNNKSYSKSATVFIDISSETVPVFPTVARAGQVVSIAPDTEADTEITIELYSVDGKCIRIETQTFNGNPLMIHAPMQAGLYTVKLSFDARTIVQTIIVRP